jgi:hypothetical protein
VTRVEIKTIDPPQSVKDAMEKQMRAEREKRAAILTAEGVRQSQILTAEGEKQSNILRAEGEKQSSILKAEGQAQAIQNVFQSIHENNPDEKLLAYQYLLTLPQIAQGPGNTVWMVPTELTGALRAVSSVLEGGADKIIGDAGQAAGRKASAEVSGSPTVSGQPLVPPVTTPLQLSGIEQVDGLAPVGPLDGADSAADASAADGTATA